MLSHAEAYLLGWQILHLLEAVHSCGYAFNGLGFEKIVIIESPNSKKKKHRDISYRDVGVTFIDFS